MTAGPARTGGTSGYSAETLRSVDRVKLAKRIAETEADIARQEAIEEWLTDQLDAEELELLNLRRRLSDFQQLAAQLDGES